MKIKFTIIFLLHTQHKNNNEIILIVMKNFFKSNIESILFFLTMDKLNARVRAHITNIKNILNVKLLRHALL